MWSENLARFRRHRRSFSGGKAFVNCAMATTTSTAKEDEASLEYSSEGMDIALGIVLAAAIGGLCFLSFRIFEPYILPAVLAAVVATALRPICNRISVALGVIPWMSDLERERFDSQLLLDRQRREYIFSNLQRNFPRNAGLFTVVYVLLWVRNPIMAAGITVAIVSMVLAGFAGLALARMIVTARMIHARSAAAALTLTALISVVTVLSVIFAIGITKDLSQGVRDTAKFARRIVQESGGDDMIVRQLDLAESKLREAVQQNREKVVIYAGKVKEYTAVDLEEVVSMVSSDQEVELIRLKDAVVRQIPKSMADIKSHGQHISKKVQELEIDWEPYKEQAMDLAKSLATGAGGFFAKLGEYVQRIGVLVTFLGLLPIFLGREKSTVSIVTDIIPLPSRFHNETVELDVRNAISTLFWGVVRTFALELAFVHMLFGAFRLNFEYLAPFLAALGSSVPLLPGGVLWTALLGATQLASRKRWMELGALLILHLLLDTSLDQFYNSARKDMTIGGTILNQQLISLSIILAVPMFEKKALLFGPLIVILCVYVYEIFVFLNTEKQGAIIEDFEEKKIQ